MTLHDLKTVQAAYNLVSFNSSMNYEQKVKFCPSTLRKTVQRLCNVSETKRGCITKQKINQLTGKLTAFDKRYCFGPDCPTVGLTVPQIYSPEPTPSPFPPTSSQPNKLAKLLVFIDIPAIAYQLALT